MATMKSVPRMPIVAVGATSENAPGLRCPRAPLTTRSAPRKRTNAARSAFGSCGRKRKSSIRNCVFSWSATTWPSSKRRTTREPGAVVTTVPESTRWFRATGLLWAGVAPARTSPFNSCTTAAPRALAAEKKPAIPNARTADERYRSLIGLTFPPFRHGRQAATGSTTASYPANRARIRPAIITALPPGLRRQIRGAVLRARRLGYSLSEVAAEIALHFASAVCGPEAKGRGFLRPGRRRRGQRDGQLDLAGGGAGRRFGRHDVHRHLEILLLRPGPAGKREGKNRTDRILRESLHDLPPSSNRLLLPFREPGGLHARLARVIDFKLQPERLAGPAVRQARHQFVLRRPARDQRKLQQVPALAQIRLPAQLAAVAVADELDVPGQREAQGRRLQRLRAVEHQAHGLGPLEHQRHRRHRRWRRLRGEKDAQDHAQHQSRCERKADHCASRRPGGAGRRAGGVRQRPVHKSRARGRRWKRAQSRLQRRRVLMQAAAVRTTLQMLLNRSPRGGVEPPVEAVVQLRREVAAFHWMGSYPFTRSPAEKGSTDSSARRRRRARCSRDLSVPSGVSRIVSSSSRLYPSTSCIVTTARCSGLSRSRAHRIRSRNPLRSACSSGPSLIAGNVSRGLSSPSASAARSAIGERARRRTRSTYSR